MMKKLLLSLILGCSVLLGYSQKGCTPDPQYVGGGIYPDTITGLDDAYVGQPYDQLITIITPADTVYSLIPATIDNIDLVNVTGLPPNFSYECDPTTCSFPGGSTKCARVYSTSDPTVSDIGFYPIEFECLAYATVPFVGGTTLTFVSGGYAIEIVAATEAVIHQFNNETFELRSPFPNPVTDKAQIKFIAGRSEDIMFRIYNLLGKEVYFRQVRSVKGVNLIDINTIDFPAGIYMYSINNQEQFLTERMIVN